MLKILVHESIFSQLSVSNTEMSMFVPCQDNEGMTLRCAHMRRTGDSTDRRRDWAKKTIYGWKQKSVSASKGPSKTVNLSTLKPHF